MTWSVVSLRGLQILSLLSALIAIVGGGTFVLYGTEGVALVLGTEFPALSARLTNASDELDTIARPSFDLMYRALGWYWLMSGVMLLWIIPSIAHRTDWFRLIHIGFMAVGVASVITLMDTGPNEHIRYIGLVPEFGIPLLAIAWQGYVARQAIHN